jgi:S-formylglutathione hydrolase
LAHFSRFSRSLLSFFRTIKSRSSEGTLPDVRLRHAGAAGAGSSVSTFAPICNPVISPWGQGCFAAYLGDDRKTWDEYDATHLIEAGATLPPALIDHGTGDEFLAEELFPQNLQAACAAHGQALTLRMQPDYDHSYHFIASFIGEHLAFHARAMAG